MGIKYINPFLSAVKNVLEQMGVTGVKRGCVVSKETMHVDYDITSVVGLVGGIRGNIAYSLSQETAKQIVSTMMMGMPVEELDEMARSGIGEFSNMVTGNANALLCNRGEVNFDISPPSVIFGKDVFFVISSVKTISVEVETPLGKIEINIGIEV